MARATSRTMLRPAPGVNGTLTSRDPRPSAGSGPAAKPDSVEILWPDVSRQPVCRVAVNPFLKVVFGDTHQP